MKSKNEIYLLIRYTVFVNGEATSNICLTKDI